MISSSHQSLRALSAILAVCLLGSLAACTGSRGSNEAPGPSAQALLADAKKKLDETDSVHFNLTSADLPEGNGTALVSGDGNAARPDKFQGDLKISIGSSIANVKVISIGGKVYAKLPIAPFFAEVNPEQFGVGDPGRLMAAEGGVTNLLVKAEGAKFGKKSRVNGEIVQEVEATIPGSVVKDLLTSADPTQPVTAIFSIVEGSKELRRAVVKGPFYEKGVNSTFTIVLDRYGEKVDISAPKIG